MNPAAYVAVRDFLRTNYSATPLFFENEQTDAPSSAWCLMEGGSATYRQTSIGAGSQAANRFDDDGSFYLHVMVPVGTGVADAYGYAYTLADLFRGLTLMGGNLEFDDVIVGYGRHEDDGNFYRVSVNVGWRVIDARPA